MQKPIIRQTDERVPATSHSPKQPLTLPKRACPDWDHFLCLSKTPVLILRVTCLKSCDIRRQMLWAPLNSKTGIRQGVCFPGPWLGYTPFLLPHSHALSHPPPFVPHPKRHLGHCYSYPRGFNPRAPNLLKNTCKMQVCKHDFPNKLKNVKTHHPMPTQKVLHWPTSTVPVSHPHW